MSALKPWALFVVTWASLATLAQANPKTGFSDWMVWSATTGVVNNDNPGASQMANVRPDVFLNFGSAPYAEEGALTTGSGQPWYTSPSYTNLFKGGAPTAADE